nr:MAG TPA: hypothetical protein [Caudoviricetes sp.]
MLSFILVFGLNSIEEVLPLIKSKANVTLDIVLGLYL